MKCWVLFEKLHKMRTTSCYQHGCIRTGPAKTCVPLPLGLWLNKINQCFLKVLRIKKLIQIQTCFFFQCLKCKSTRLFCAFSRKKNQSGFLFCWRFEIIWSLIYIENRRKQCQNPLVAEVPDVFRVTQIIGWKTTETISAPCVMLFFKNFILRSFHHGVHKSGSGRSALLPNTNLYIYIYIYIYTN